MRKLLYPFIFILLLLNTLAACSEKDSFLLKGKLTDSISIEEPILVVYDDPEAKLDTIFPTKGEFTYKLSPDTLTLLRLINKQGQIIPIFAHKGWEVQIKGTFTSPELKGNGANQEYQEFLKALASVHGDEKIIIQEAEKFIKNHPQSIVSAYLLDRYFIQQPYPDIHKITQLIKPLSGTVKDSRILSVAIKALPPKNISDITYVSYYSYKDRNGKYISWNNKDKHNLTLINFWASWSQNSLAERKKLEQLIDSLPLNTLKILNVSLDIDKQQWLKACKADTTSWIETCDFKGWENQLVKQHNISCLPANILVDKNRKIIETNLTEEMIKQKIKETEKEKKEEGKKGKGKKA